MSIRLFPSLGDIIYTFLTLNDFMISLIKQDFLTNCKTFLKWIHSIREKISFFKILLPL